MDGVARELRIGDVRLHPAHREPAGERAAAPVLDHVAQLAHAGRLAHDAVVDGLAAAFHALDDARGAVDRRSLLVGGEEQGDRPGMAWFFPQKHFRGHDESGERGLHVGGAPAIEPVLAHRGHERVRLPLGERSRRHHVGMAREADQGPRGSAPRPQVGDLAADHRFAVEAGARQALGQELLAAAVFGGDRAARDQCPGKT